VVVYLEVDIQAMRVDEAEINPEAAHTGQLAGSRGAEGRGVNRSRHPQAGQQLEGPAAPQSHLWVREVSYGAMERISGQS